jgi:hypothetical protein
MYLLLDYPKYGPWLPMRIKEEEKVKLKSLGVMKVAYTSRSNVTLLPAT